MAVSPDFLTYVLDQLTGLGGVRAKRMFGGVGLYAGDRFFGLIDDNALYFKVDDATRDDFLARGMGPFRPYKDRPEYSMSYYQVPADVLEDTEALVAWAARSVRIAAVKPPGHKRKPQRRPRPR
jgi:DNA transformation protein